MQRITRFEKTRLISARALQLSLGAPPMVKVAKGQTMIEVARDEFMKKILPLSVLRKFPNGEIIQIDIN